MSKDGAVYINGVTRQINNEKYYKKYVLIKMTKHTLNARHLTIDLFLCIGLAI